MRRDRPAQGVTPFDEQEAIATRKLPPELVCRGQLADKPVHLLVHDCEVFQVEALADGGVKWTSVLTPDFYPMRTTCIRQSLTVKEEVLTVALCHQAVGAWGCCATGGICRSVAGQNWKRKSGL